MNLTTAQQTTLAQHIRASTDPRVVAALPTRVDTVIADVYNESTSFWVWRTELPVEEYRLALTWTEVDALTAGKARIWEWLTGNMTLPIDPSRTAVRQGLADCWASNTTTRAALTAAGKRRAGLAESLFVSGTGTEATPGLLGVEGPVTLQDISACLNANP